MSQKRNIDELLDDQIDQIEQTEPTRKQVKFDDNIKKHTLDSDEEDEDKDKYNILDDNDIEGEEETSAERQDGEIRMTAFNMTEEMQLGHFDKEGHFIWKNEQEVRDNWLDNVDWQRVNIAKNVKDGDEEYKEKGLADESDEEEMQDAFDHIASYRKIVTYLKPGETITKALKRLGGDITKLSSIERLRRRKAGTLGNNKDVTELTELANGVLTNMGNMDVYQETYEQITQKINNHDKKNKSKANIVEAELDMYADDFDDLEKKRIVDGGDQKPKDSASSASDSKMKEVTELRWEFKWDQNKDAVEGPYDTRQMHKWAEEGHFKTGVWVRKCGAADCNFYSSHRIDFDLYL